MPEVDPEARQRLKQQSREFALTCAKASGVLAVAGGIMSILPNDQLKAAGRVASISAAMIGLLGSYYFVVAADPPRDDFDEVWITGATIDDASVPTEEPVRSLHLLAARHMQLSDACYALLTALERHDGAIAASDFNAAGVQADAVRQNANVCIELQDSIRGSMFTINETWNAVKQDFAIGFENASLGEVQAFYKECWGSPPDAPGAALNEVASGVSGAAEDVLEAFDPGAAHPILSETEIPEESESLFDDAFAIDLANLSGAMAALVLR
ncbi:hypothetical protein [Bradyrhizobium sp. AUGA SZCCT0283]|uniref:hypothetical protein n=1 Tax=Bradyrhizobium sp. AUGA SZCCT0283 TaxID=2807671 RepID=UPI001BA89A86|nr:hypothetical protein [Bradyrhizobium sp. AUGA SZCCT0283]MBR1274258.1 hypothetical protein [Bradyrhizobium sp. AUGA SZCCT0283]